MFSHKKVDDEFCFVWFVVGVAHENTFFSYDMT